MKYLLDTNICIHFFRGRYNLIDKFEQIGLRNCAISEITLAELVYGAENSHNPQKNHDIIEKFTCQLTIIPVFDSINRYGKEKSRLRKSGIMVSDFDLLIGCTAVENNLIMVTENVKDFERITAISIENWIVR
jgi:tRNA(fMet)-specific endonuclease VapC